jgi:osmotically-inducible protein OsmY
MSFIVDLRRFLIVALAAMFMAGCAGTSRKESTGEYFDDTTITTKVKAALLNDKDISGWRINVETFKGVVQLSGFANSLAERRKAVAVTRGVSGVKSVKDDIIVP